MERKKLIGAVDIGYGWTKAEAAGGITWRQPSILGEARQLFEENIKENYVQYRSSSAEYFVGDLALKHSQVKYAGTAEDKAKTWTTKILLETALGIIAPQAGLYLVTGLPVDYYFKQRSSMEELLQQFNQEQPYELQLGRFKQLVRPWIFKSKIVPQPFGSAMNYLLDSRGQMARPDEATKKLLIIDVGYYTLDLLILDAMEIGKESSSPAGLGVDTAYKLIQDYLKDRFGKAPNRYELDPYVRAGEYEGYDIKPLISKAFEALGAQIDLEIATLNTTFYKYIITGGWASLLADYVRVPKDRMEVFDQLGNVQGYNKIGARLWGAAL